MFSFIINKVALKTYLCLISVVFCFVKGPGVCFSGGIDGRHFIAMAYKVTCHLASSYFTGFSPSWSLSSSHKGLWSFLWSCHAPSNHRAFAHIIPSFWNPADLLYLVNPYTSFKLPPLSPLQGSLPPLYLWISWISLLFVLTGLYLCFIALTPAVVLPSMFSYLMTASIPLRM